MWHSILRWLAPPVFDDDPERTDTARLLNGFLLIALGAAIVYSLWTAFSGGLALVLWLGLGAFFIFSIVALLYLRRGYVRQVGFLLVSLLWSFCTYIVVQFGGIHDVMVLGYFITVIMAGLALGVIGALGFSLLSGLALGVAYYLERAGRLDLSDLVPSQFSDLILALLLLSLMGFLVWYAVKRLQAMQVGMEQSRQAVSHANETLMASREAAAAERGRLFERMLSALAVTRTATATMSVSPTGGAEGDAEGASETRLQQTLKRTVDEIAEQFGFPHVAVFWADHARGTVIRQAIATLPVDSTGPVGVTGPVDGSVPQMRLGEGFVGIVTAEAEGRFISDVTRHPYAIDEPDAPRRGCALALPILSSEDEARALGALVVRHPDPRGLTDDDRVTLEALLAQLSLATDQAQAFDALQADLRTAEQAYQDIRRADWQRLLRAERGIGYVSTDQATSLVDAAYLDQAGSGDEAPHRSNSPVDMDAAAQLQPGVSPALSGEPSETDALIHVPIELEGQKVAEVQAHLGADMGGWTEERVAMLETLSGQLSQAMERARLHRETQRRAARERVLREITDEMGRASDLSSLMQITVTSLNRSLGGSHLYVRLLSDNAGDPVDRSTGQNHQDDDDRREGDAFDV